MAKDDTRPSNLESINTIYSQRVENLDAADQQVRDEQDENEKGFDHPDTPLVEEQRFVGNPDDLRKEVSSEEEFSEGLSDNPVEVEVGGETVTDPAEAPAEKPAKKTAAKKTAAKKS